MGSEMCIRDRYMITCIYTRRIKKGIPRWGTVQMAHAERPRTINYVLAESSRWLLHRRRDTKINITGCREKNKKINRKEKRKRLNVKTTTTTTTTTITVPTYTHTINKKGSTTRTAESVGLWHESTRVDQERKSCDGLKATN